MEEQCLISARLGEWELWYYGTLITSHPSDNVGRRRRGRKGRAVDIQHCVRSCHCFGLCHRSSSSSTKSRLTWKRWKWRKRSSRTQRQQQQQLAHKLMESTGSMIVMGRRRLLYYLLVVVWWWCWWWWCPRMSMLPTNWDTKMVARWWRGHAAKRDVSRDDCSLSVWVCLVCRYVHHNHHWIIITAKHARRPVCLPPKWITNSIWSSECVCVPVLYCVLALFTLSSSSAEDEKKRLCECVYK